MTAGSRSHLFILKVLEAMAGRRGRDYRVAVARWLGVNYSEARLYSEGRLMREMASLALDILENKPDQSVETTYRGYEIASRPMRERGAYVASAFLQDDSDPDTWVQSGIATAWVRGPNAQMEAIEELKNAIDRRLDGPRREP